MSNDQFLIKPELIGRSETFQKKLKIIKKIALSDNNVLISGDSGTGKDLVAQKIHKLSRRNKGPFIPVNCANLSSELLETELFGHVRGAFTGAMCNKVGLIDQAKGGTFFLDEIGDMSMAHQAKLLRIIEEKKIRPVGSTSMREIDVRFIFATNKDLVLEMSNRTFRKDLYFRISIIKLFLPPLKNRKEDINELIDFFLAKENENKSKKIITERAYRKLISYDYPGNVRELKSVIKRACFFSDGDKIDEDDVIFEKEYKLEKGFISKNTIREILEECHWNKTRAALCLGKSRRQLYRLIDKYHLHTYIRRRSSLE